MNRVTTCHTSRRAALILSAACLLAGFSQPINAAKPKADAPLGITGWKPPVDLVTPSAREGSLGLNDALALASVEYKPVMALFHSPTCGWCDRLKREVLTDSKVREVLKHFIVVESDVSADPIAAELYQVRSVPTLLFFSANGRERFRLNGFLTKTELLKVLNALLDGKLEKEETARVAQLLEKFHSGQLAPNQWPALMLALKSDPVRDEVMKGIAKMEPTPRQPLVALLQDSRLAVRLGALELLERLAGDDYGFDPWLEDHERNAAALEKWHAWARDTKQPAASSDAAGLSDEAIESYLKDMVADQPERSRRAMRMLERGGEAVVTKIEQFQARNPALPEAARIKLRQMRYSLLLPPAGAISSDTLAHRLVFANLDVRLQTLREIAPSKAKALPVLRDFLSDHEPLVRETAIDSLVLAGGLKAVPILEEHLKRESDSNVVYAALRGLGGVASKRGLRLLCSYLNDSNEDLVVVALESIGRLKSATAADSIKKSLADPRWRVRVAALEAVGALQLQSLTADIEKLLDDPDEFVRTAAVNAIAETSKGEAATKLEQVFMRYDAQKAAVVKAYDKLNLPLPASAINALEGKPPELVVSVIDNLDRSSVAATALLVRFAAHANRDVSAAALRQLAQSSLDNADARRVFLEALKRGDRQSLLALMDAVRVRAEVLARFDPKVLQVDFAGDTRPPAQPTAAQKKMNDLFDAFGDGPPTKTSTGTNAIRSADDLFALFADGPKAGEKDFSGIIQAVRQHADNTRDPELAITAACLLCRLGDTCGAPLIVKSLDKLTTDQKNNLAENLDVVRRHEAVELIRRLLQDDSQEVRETAINGLFARGANHRCVELLFAELVRPDSKLRPKEVYDSSRLLQLCSKGEGKRALRRWTETLLVSRHENLQTFGLILLSRCWQSGDLAAIGKFVAAPSPWQRRAAVYACGRGAQEDFTETVLPAALKDPSPHVRAAIPAVFGRLNERWVQYLDETTLLRDPYFGISYAGTRSLPDKARTALKQLLEDPSPMVRFEACFCLLVNHEPFGLASFAGAIESLPDPKSATERLSEYLVEDYQQLGQNWAFLLPYVESQIEKDKLSALYAHFGASEEDGAAIPKPALKTEATYLRPKQPPMAAPANQELKLVYFSKPGCPDCERVSRIIEQLKESFPRLVVEEHNINKRKSLLYSEALCERFGVSEKLRLVAPTVFCGAGVLVKDKIVFDRLGHLLARSAAVPLSGWYIQPQQELQAADAAINRRFSTINLGVVLLAGLLDGINPCAFATIIFLLSWLRVAKRSSREIAQIGTAYCAGVFLAYYVLGLGLVEVITRLSVLQWVSQAVNWLMAAFTLVLAGLSLRDGVLCLRGQMTEMTLQLPDMLKLRIHSIIRTGMRHRRFVMVAFGIGLVVALLELACTGQVYAPTLLFMTKSGNLLAMAYLLLYNLAFITPLLIVFLLAYGGMQSETFTRFLQQRAALVKFGTALLFGLMFLLLVFGQRLIS